MRSMNKVYQTLQFLNGEYDIDKHKNTRLSDAIERGSEFSKGCKDVYIDSKYLPATDTGETECFTCSLGAAFEYLIAKNEYGNKEILELADDRYDVLASVAHYLEQIFPHLAQHLFPSDLCQLADLAFEDKLINDFLYSSDKEFRDAVLSLKGQWSLLKMSNPNVFEYDGWNKTLHQFITEYNDYLFDLGNIEDPRLEVSKLVRTLGY